jgi:quinol monooxygenase YgiN
VAYVVCAKWRAKPEEIDEVARCLAALTQLSRAEPGNLQYQVHRDPENPELFFIYEQYADEAAFQAHVDSPHFQSVGLGDGIPRLADRSREFYWTVDD